MFDSPSVLRFHNQFAVEKDLWFLSVKAAQ